MYGTRRTIVGNLLFFDLNQTLVAMDTIEKQMADLREDILHAFGGATIAAMTVAAVKQPAQMAWFHDVFLPAWSEWDAIYAKSRGMSRDSWVGAARGDWGLVETWHHHVLDLRDGARAHGIGLASLDPQPLPTTTLDHVVDQVGDTGRYVIYGGLALGGAFVVKMLADAIADAK